MIRRLLSVSVLAVFAVLAVAACSSNSTTSPSTSVGTYTQTDLVVGTGATAVTGNRLTVAYTGWLYDTSKTDGKGTKFDSSPNFAFTLGVGVIQGWNQGVAGMKVGGQRRLIIPPSLAYGSTSPGAGIPPNATLVFDITLSGVQ